MVGFRVGGLRGSRCKGVLDGLRGLGWFRALGFRLLLCGGAEGGFRGSCDVFQGRRVQGLTNILWVQDVRINGDEGLLVALCGKFL